MKLYIDDVNIGRIENVWDYYPFVGITSNPTILKNNKEAPFDILRKLRSFIGDDKDLMVQVISTKAEEMVKEAEAIVNVIGKKHTFVKIPANVEGIKAIKMIKEQKTGIRTCATAVYTVAQGFLAAKAGASYVAPYVNRIDNLGGDGIQVAKDIQDIFRTYNLSCEVLAASFKTTRQVIELAKYGIDAATINLEVWDAFFKNEIVSAAVDTFNADFEELVGKGKTFLECE